MRHKKNAFTADFTHQIRAKFLRDQFPNCLPINRTTNPCPTWDKDLQYGNCADVQEEERIFRIRE